MFRAATAAIMPVRLLISLGLLAVLALWLDPVAIIGSIRELDPRWLAAAMAVGTLQYVLSAERWRRTAARLEVPLGKREALANYYVAGFANQVLPGGIAGDAGRAWRHSRSSGRPGPAIRAVILERASGQFVLVLAVTAVLAATTPGHRILVALDASPWMVAALGAGLLLAGMVAAWRAGRVPGWLRTLIHDTHRALLARGAWPIQLSLSLMVFATYCAMFACAGKMIGADVAMTTLTVLAPIVLLAMLLPVSVAGWGVREAAAASVWMALGLPAAEGVAVSIGYGALCLLASLPGAVILLTAPIRRRRQTS